MPGRQENFSAGGMAAHRRARAKRAAPRRAAAEQAVADHAVRKGWYTASGLVAAAGLGLLAVVGLRQAKAAYDIYRRKGHAGWLEGRLPEVPAVDQPAFKRRLTEVIQPFADAHAAVVGRLRYAGKAGGMFELRETAALDGLLQWGGQQADMAWVNPGGPSTRCLVKLGLAEDQETAMTFTPGAKLSSRNEILANRRLTKIGCPFVPKLYACCRYKIERGWFVKPAYLVVLVMDAVSDGICLRGTLFSHVGPPWSDELSAAVAAFREALKELRMVGVFHCDLHADNLLLTSGGVAITDFGRCLLLDGGETWEEPACVFGGTQYAMDRYHDQLERAAGRRLPPLGSDMTSNVKVLRAIGVNPDYLAFLYMYGDSAAEEPTPAEKERNASRTAFVKAVRDARYVNTLHSELPADAAAELQELRALGPRSYIPGYAAWSSIPGYPA